MTVNREEVGLVFAQQPPPHYVQFLATPLLHGTYSMQQRHARLLTPFTFDPAAVTQRVLKIWNLFGCVSSYETSLTGRPQFRVDRFCLSTGTLFWMVTVNVLYLLAVTNADCSLARQRLTVKCDRRWKGAVVGALYIPGSQSFAGGWSVGPHISLCPVQLRLVVYLICLSSFRFLPRRLSVQALISEVFLHCTPGDRYRQCFMVLDSLRGLAKRRSGLERIG